jgi:hypothetical protein
MAPKNEAKQSYRNQEHEPHNYEHQRGDAEHRHEYAERDNEQRPEAHSTS